MISIEKSNFIPFKYEIREEIDEKPIIVEVKQEEIEVPFKGNVNSSRGSFKCNFCSRSFTRQDRLDRHFFSHTGIVSIVSTKKRLKMIKIFTENFSNQFQKTHKCHYEGCDKEYSCDSHLRRHIRTSHEMKPIVGSYKCKDPKCGREFTNISNMHRHFKEQHWLHYYFPCTECDCHFRRRFKLKTHLMTVHKIGDFKYICAKCESGFFNRPSYLKHIATHEEKLRRPCDNCELTFLKWSDLVKHKREAHKVVQTGRFYCDLCTRVFTWKKSLRAHMKVHEKVRSGVFPCYYENCSKFYTTKSNLKAHIRSKHEGKTFKCPVCSYELTTKQRYNQHLNAHLDLKHDAKDLSLSLLTGAKENFVEEVAVDSNIPYLFPVPPPSKIEVPTESEVSD